MATPTSNLMFVLLFFNGLLANMINGERITGKYENATATVGDDVFLKCPGLDVQIAVWTLNENFVNEEDERIYIMPGRGILLLNVEIADTGRYLCRNVIQDKIIESTIELDVAPALDLPELADTDFKCGTPRARGKIVGGRMTYAGQIPWQVMLWHTSRESVFCGGALLNRFWVITAAHCIYFSEANKRNIEVRFGVWDSETEEDFESHHQADEIIVHPNYNIETYDSDIALIRLKQPVHYTDYVVPVCLPSQQRADKLMRPGQKGFVSGWGATEEDGDYLRYLRRVRLQVTDQHLCGTQHTDLLTNNMFCGAPLPGKQSRDACQGDSGGPFVVRDSDHWYLVGLVSWGIGCGRPQFPGVYTRVIRFKSWIDDIIQEHSCSSESERRLNSSLQLKDELIQKLQTELEGLRAFSTNASYERAEIMTTLSMKPHVKETISDSRHTCTDEAGCLMLQSELRAVCVEGYCRCNNPNYNPYTCLPEVGGCTITENPTEAAAVIESDNISPSVYACLSSEHNAKAVHVISVYTSSSGRVIDVYLRSSSRADQLKPVIMVVSSHKSIRWIVEVGEGIILERIILISASAKRSNVVFTRNPGNVIVDNNSNSASIGYGNDDTDGNTVGMLIDLVSNYGSVSSFTGVYRAEAFHVDVSVGGGQDSVRRGEPSPTTASIITAEHQTREIITSPPKFTEDSLTQTPSPESFSLDRWTAFDFTSDDNWNGCVGGQRYTKPTGLDVGAYVGVVLCSSSKYKIFISDDPHEMYLNVADSHGTGQDHCQFVGASKFDRFNIDSDNFWDTPTAKGYHRSNWDDALRLGDIGGGVSGTWHHSFKWYECGIIIP